MRAIAFLILISPLTIAQQYRAFWADAFHSGYKTPQEIDNMVDDVATARGNAIFVEVRHRGGSYFLNSIEPAVEDSVWSPGFDALQYLIGKAHACGIEVHAWFPVTPLWPLAKPPVDPNHTWNKHGPSAKGSDMWMTATAAGKISTSVDPGNPAALRYLADVIVDPARHYALDGLHLDYIRYPEDADYGWNPTAVERFQRTENRAAMPVSNDPQWSAFRRRQVTELVRQVYLRAYEINPSVKISAALITWGNGPLNDAGFTSTDAYGRVFQDWRGWMEEGILDLAIPMNYFREPQNAAFLDRWLAFEKDRQYNRGLVVGLGNYLNAIPQTLAQLTRVLAGNRALGVNFYSYAVTNTENSAGGPTEPNTNFYKAIGDYFATDAAPPVLPWKKSATRGHLCGQLNIGDGPGWLKDNATIRIESDTKPNPTVRTVATDGTGFFGAVDLEPDRYRIRILRAGLEVYRSAARDLAAGAIVRFDVTLGASDFATVIPRISAASATVAAPGDLIALTGESLGLASNFAAAVPLPVDLGGLQVLVNGTPAPLFLSIPGRIELQLPYRMVEEWSIVVRYAGLESNPFRLAFAPAAPVITGVRPVENYLEIYATGLGVTNPAIPAGIGANGFEPFPRVVQPVSVLVNGVSVTPAYAGLKPYAPGIYQVNIQLPQGVAQGDVQLRTGEVVSNIARFGY